jgi:hypothetical protein
VSCSRISCLHWVILFLVRLLGGCWCEEECCFLSAGCWCTSSSMPRSKLRGVGFSCLALGEMIVVVEGDMEISSSLMRAADSMWLHRPLAF